MRETFGSGDNANNVVLRIEQLYPGVIIKANELAKPMGVSVSKGCLHGIAVHQMALADNQDKLEPREIDSFNEITVSNAFDKGKWETTILRLGRQPLSLLVQELFIAYMRTRDELVRFLLLNTLHNERLNVS